ncbi:LOW QUALITY PROTEIN: uncharacterized protein C2orf78-like [Urocitellus parryii]
MDFEKLMFPNLHQKDEFLCMTENFQDSSLHGTAHSLQLSLPVMTNAASLTGSVCNFSRASAPAATSAWLLPSNCGTSFQPLMGSASLYQHASTAMVSGVTGRNQTPMAPAPCPSISEWYIPGSAEKSSSSLRDFNLTVTDQNTADYSLSMTSQYDKTSEANVMVPGYPLLSGRLVQVTLTQIPNQGQSLSLPHQEGSQVYYYDQNTLGTLFSGEHDPCLQSYGSVPYAGSSATAPQPEMVTVLQKVQPTNALPSVSNPGIYCSVFAQPITENIFQVMETCLEMEASLGLQSPSQTFCLPQPLEFLYTCKNRKSQIVEKNSQTELGYISIITLVQSCSDFLALPPNQSQKQTEIKNLYEKTMLSELLEAYQIPENQDPPLFPLDIPEIHKLLASIGPLDQEEKPHSENIHLGKNSLSLEDQGTLENGIESSSGFADLTALLGDIYLPELFSSLKDFDQLESPTTTKSNNTRAIMVNQGQEFTSVIKSPSDPVRNNKHKASEYLHGTPQAKMQPRNLQCSEEVAHRDADSSRGPVHTAKHSISKPQKAASSRNSKAKGHGQEKTKRTRVNNSRKAEERKQPGNKVKAEENPTVPKMKWKWNQPELCQETFKKPQSCLGMHMLELVQFFQALGKQNDKKTGLSSSWALGNSGSTLDPHPWLAVNSPEKTQVKAQNPDISSEGEGPSPSIYEPPPPGKVKLVPPFLTLEKPPPQQVIKWRPQSLASGRSTGFYPAQDGPASLAQPIAVNQSQTATANPSWMCPAKQAQPILNHANQSVLTASTQPTVPWSAASRPAPYKTSSCTSLQWQTVPTVETKPKSQLPKSQNQYLLQDFALQPIPWRKPNVTGQVISTPITNQQRPEQEAMKKKVQQERENAAKYTALGRVQCFIERERDMEISRYNGYTIDGQKSRVPGPRHCGHDAIDYCGRPEAINPMPGSQSVEEVRSSAVAPQPEMVTTLKEVQPTNVLPSVSNPGIYCSVFAQPITEENFQKPLNTYQIAMENQDPPLLPLDIPEIPQLLASIGPLDEEEKPHSENIHLERNSLSLEDQGTLENGIEFSSGFADLTALLGDFHLPELFSSLKDLDQPESPTITKSNDTKAIMVNQEQEIISALKGPNDPLRKNKHKASESPHGTPQAKMQPRDLKCALGGEVAHRDADSSRAPVHTDKHSNSKSQEAASSRNSKVKGHGQEKTKRTRENNSRKAEERKQPGIKVKAEEKPNVPKMKRKRNQPELCQETFAKRPRSCLYMHMLESVQVFHALGKKKDKKTGLSSSQALGNSGTTQDPHPCLAMKLWLAVKCPEKSQIKAQNPDISADGEGLSPSIDEPPPPGKVKLVPLPFLTLEKPPPRPVINRRPQSLASRRPTGAYPAHSGPASSAQPMAVNTSQPATANPSWIRPAKPAHSVLTHAIQSRVSASTQPSVPWSAASGPAPYKTSSCTSLHWQPVPNVGTKPQSQLPKPQNQYLLQDFALQPIPWRKPNVPGQGVSTPITKQQRPEREAMKKKAQQERENAAKYTALGRVQCFIERERKMEIACYHGCTM